MLCACRTPNEVTGGQGNSGQTIEMVEGSYNNADSHAAANPFGFDSFGNSLAAPAQHASRPPRVQQPSRQPLVSHLRLQSTSTSVNIVSQSCKSIAPMLFAHLRNKDDRVM